MQSSIFIGSQDLDMGIYRVSIIMFIIQHFNLYTSKENRLAYA